MILAVGAERAAGARMGVGRTLERLLLSWSRQGVPFERIRVVSPTALDDLTEEPLFEPDVVGSRGPGIWWQTTKLRREAAGADVLFGFYTLPLGFRGKCVVANLGIYEGPFAIPGWRARLHSRHYAISARRADAVIVNAPSTRDDLVRYYGVDRGKIVVLCHGTDARFRPLAPRDESRERRKVAELLGTAAPFFLFVGKTSDRRHVPNLLRAFRRVVADHPSYRLLLAGPWSSEPPLALELEELGLTGSVRHIEHLDQDTLALAYRAARALVMPTSREGFSLPILEAMASGCPVLALQGASVGALEFIDENVEGGAQQAVLFADDPSPESLAAALGRLASDDALCAELGAGGVRCASAFPSWDEHAESVMEVLAEVASR